MIKINPESDDIVTVARTRELKCMCRISIEDIRFAAKGLKLRIDCLRYVGLGDKFSGLIIGTENFHNSQLYFCFLKMFPATIINLKFGECVKEADNREFWTLKPRNERIGN